ncbi:hypothetical protein BDF22DRAFT_702415 [Syncephalis plumigaleata]|nr:hypothetical protein BDF22DRAFT_702415 [Syncephalis plumigaleata]
MGRKSNYNPVEAHRKAMHKREIKKNKEERRKQRESKLETANLAELREQVEHYTALEAEDRLDAASRKRFEQAKSRLQKATKIQQEIRQNRPRDTSANYTSSSATPTIPKDPTRSIYYHPTLNPYGVPPPGQPYREIDDDNEVVASDDNTDDNEDEDEDTSNSELDDMPELPPESPPAPIDSDDNNEEDEDLPDLPEGTPPPLPSEVEETSRTMMNPPINPPPIPPYAMRGHPPPPPPHVMHRPPHPHRIPNPRMAPPMMDPLNPEEPYQLFPQHQQPCLPPSPPPPPPPQHQVTSTSAAVAASNATISAKPQLRDLQKELTTLVPTAVRRKMEGSTSNTRHREDDNYGEPSLTTKRMRVNTAPGLTPTENTTPVASTQPVAKSVTSNSSNSNNGKAQSTTRLQDEYSNFMKEMEGLM